MKCCLCGMDYDKNEGEVKHDQFICMECLQDNMLLCSSCSAWIDSGSQEFSIDSQGDCFCSVCK